MIDESRSMTKKGTAYMLLVLGMVVGIRKSRRKRKSNDYYQKKNHDFIPLFKKAVANVLPPHWQYDYKITLKEGFMPPFEPIYSLSIPELKALRE